MADIIMVAGGIIFCILLAFLLLMALAVFLSLFKREHYPDFEPEVSIIVPCYNEEKAIEKCLQGIFSLDYPKEKLEVIVVNDGRTDQTRPIIASLQKKNLNLKMINGKHEGKSASLNLGVKHAKHEILLCLDADTLILPDSLKKLVKPLASPSIGATNGSCCVSNASNYLGVFQQIEYHYNNLIRKSFSVLFKNGIWFFGAFACYKKSVLHEIGYFKKDTMTEDMDVAMEIFKAGYRTVNVHDALGFTLVPLSLRDFYKQRSRWWIGALQTLHKNKSLFAEKSNISILFLFISQYWWTFYALLSFPLIIYQIMYWIPYNNGSFSMLFMYFFRWFTLAGPFYVIYKIPEWGINFYSFFGVMAGIVSTILIIYAIYLFKDRLSLKNILGVFFYFPYTIILNTIIVLSLIQILFIKRAYFIHS